MSESFILEKVHRWIWRTCEHIPSFIQNGAQLNCSRPITLMRRTTVCQRTRQLRLQNNQKCRGYGLRWLYDCCGLHIHGITVAVYIATTAVFPTLCFCHFACSIQLHGMSHLDIWRWPWSGERFIRTTPVLHASVILTVSDDELLWCIKTLLQWLLWWKILRWLV